MNKNQIEKLLSEHSLKVMGSLSEDDAIFMTTNLQNSCAQSIVIYNISGEEAENLFYNRLGKKTPYLLILNRSLSKDTEIPYVVIEDSKKREKIINKLLDDVHPLHSDLKVYGITGTNGKSTCVTLCEQICLHGGLKAASLGTVGLTINGAEKDLGVTGTTPSSVDLRRVMDQLAKENVTHLFMEVSSHALVQKRLGKVMLSGAGWTSFSQDHLDYHKTMEEYFKAKSLILNYLNDDAILALPSSQKEIFKKLKNEKVVLAKCFDDYRFQEIPLFFCVHYNKDNLEVALELLSDEIDLNSLNLNNVSTPKGRFTILNAGKGFAVIDYAHTPDAIENLVNAARKAFFKSKIIILFGCGGDRDKTKRPLMAKAAEKLSDGVIVTSDNPRSEEPEDIIKEILEGLEKNPILVDIDRERAIIKGIGLLGEGDVLLIAGKGHEEYQEVKGEKKYFSDFAVVMSYKGKDD